jgi:lactoylglutathione lyase
MKHYFLLFLLASNASMLSAEPEQDKNKNQALTVGFDHVGLSVSDLEATTNFFVKTLRWKLRGGDPSYPAKFVSDGKMFLTLWQTTSKKESVKFNRKKNIGLHHLAFTVASFEALEEIHQRSKLVKGLVIEFPPELAFGGPRKHMMIREPSGNRLEFTHSPK